MMEPADAGLPDHADRASTPASVGVTASPSASLLIFMLGPLRLALHVEVVREVVRAVAIAVLPRAPAIVEGVINVRGAIVPVLDIRSRFRLAPESLHPDQHLIIAWAGVRLVGLRVDRATGFVTVERTAIEAAAPAVPGVEYVAGIARLPDGLLVINDLRGFLALDEAAQLDAATSDAGR